MSLFLCAYTVKAQISFHTFINPSSGIGDVQCFDSKPSKDGGYIATGIGKFGGSAFRPVLIKFNCKGEVDWAKNFAISSTIGNVNMKVIQCADRGYCMVNNIGSYGAYSFLVVKTDKKGNTIWKKIINNGAGNDLAQAIVQAKDGGFVIAGSTNSYGVETVGSSYNDIYIIKLNASGNAEWSKTIGNATAIEDATDITTTKDGGYALTGRYITNGAFYAMLLKVDSIGNINYLKTFGKPNHSSNGYAIAEDVNGDLLLVGSTTILQTNFQDYPDNFAIKCNAAGDTIWSKAYYGSNPNSFENASSICKLKNGNWMVGIATASYPTIGFVPNKQVALEINANGVIQKVIGFNTGSSHYPKINALVDSGIFLSGFTTLGTVTNFRTNIIKTTSSIENICGSIDYTSQTIEAYAPFALENPTHNSSQGAAVISSPYEGIWSGSDTTLCISLPIVKANFTTSNSCSNSPITFTNLSIGASAYTIYFGNGDSIVATTSEVVYTYPTSGTYTVSFIASNGCDVDTAKKVLQIGNPPSFSIIQSPDPALIGQVVTFSSNIQVDSILWSTAEKGNSITTNKPGIYYATAFINGCIVSDTIQLLYGIGDGVNIPNAISPNGDDLNPDLKIFTYGNYKFKSIKIFNRYGNMIFESTDINYRWNGTYKGLPLSPDVFYYIALFTNGTTEEIRKGDITIIK